MAAALFFSPLPIGALLSEPQRDRYGRHFRGRPAGVGGDSANPEWDQNHPLMVQTKARRGGRPLGHQRAKAVDLQRDDIRSDLLVTCRVPEEDDALSMFLVERDEYAYRTSDPSNAWA